MESGKRRRVMIACVTFETVKITDPCDYYETDNVHLLHYIKDPNSENGKIYKSFYDEVRDHIVSAQGTVYEHDIDINNFTEIMKTLIDIMNNEYTSYQNSDIFINISAGSSEYVAASTIVSMMFPSAIPFSVKTKEYTVDAVAIKDLYFREGHPVGLTNKVFEPTIVPKITIPLPDPILVKGLRIYFNSDYRAATVIQQLKENNLWIRKTDGAKSERYDSVYYHRDFVSKWINNGWIFKDKYRNLYILTDEGRRILSTFYVEKNAPT